ncbi:MAG: DNA-methyltransferase [Planctomycetota bacterium]|jgi:adenine-specific DNA-methyltransferase
MRIAKKYSDRARVVLYPGDCLDLLRRMPNGCAKLVVTSPPYNLSKKYEKKVTLEEYIDSQAAVIDECVRVLHPRGSICWQVGNYVNNGTIMPLDVVMYWIFARHKLHYRNRIVWRFEHGLHCTHRLSGRYETINWFTKAAKGYTFNLDPIRVPQKYPGKKYFKGPKAGQYSCNPKGKNPGDVWDIPNVKHNHVEKTEHPCQFPVELVERLVLSLTNEGDLVFDPFMGVGSTAVAAVLNGRRAAGADTMDRYIEIARERVSKAAQGNLRTRPRDRPIYEPPANSRLARKPKGARKKAQ